jgi:hypothetical protein
MDVFSSARGALQFAMTLGGLMFLSKKENANRVVSVKQSILRVQSLLINCLNQSQKFEPLKFKSSFLSD